MLIAVKKIGNSAGLVIPESILSEFGAKVGDQVDLRIEENRIVIKRVARSPRHGWSEDARRVAAAGDDAAIWPEFANDDDATLKV